MNIMKRIAAAFVLVGITVWLNPDAAGDGAMTSIPSGARSIAAVVSGLSRTVIVCSKI